MRLKGHPEHDGRRVWLGRDEVELLLSKAQDTEQKIAFGLGVRCGLRSKEIIGVTPADIVEDDIVGPRVRVEQAKGDWYREVPMPLGLHTTASTYADVRESSPHEILVDRTTRTLQRWVDRAAENCREETGDSAWSFLTPHDLRRTWGTLLVEAGVEPGMIMEWGGWKDWETFRKHYLGAYSPEMERRQAAMVPWLEAQGETKQQTTQPDPYTSLPESTFEE